MLQSDDAFDTGVTAIPLEAGLRFNFTRDSQAWNPYLGAGGTYYALETDFGNIDDEAGFYASLGSEFGNGVGADFFETDGFDGSRVDLDLGGFVANMGVVWKW